MHLWEAKHPYYCNLGNYFDNNCGDSYDTWAEFLDEYRNADFDMNLVFRFDWQESADDDDELPPFNGDTSFRNGQLQIFWMGQRKGLYRYSTVDVCRDDEPSILEFLRPRWEHMRELWAPLSDGS